MSIGRWEPSATLTYTLGNLYAVQFYEQAKHEIPHIEDEIAAGQLMVLRRWLGHKIHRWVACSRPIIWPNE